MKKITGVSLIVLSVIIFAYVMYQNSKYSGITREFSPYTLLSSSWEKYKVKFINKDGRVIDYTQNNITTSEGQSYAMLRAVWVDDKETFDLVWKWTQENLKRKNDTLFGWRWGKLDNDKYGFIAGGGENSASDADSDIALALIFASSRWSDKKYLDAARTILSDLWKINTAEVQGKRYLIAGNWAQSGDELVINPSYFAPYAWRIFAKVDTKNDWGSLVTPAYDLLEQSSKNPLDKGTSVNLPPDWVVMERKTGKIKASTISNLTTNYSFDAVRVPWRVALDYQWNKNDQAKNYLIMSCQKLNNEYTPDGILDSGYTHDGTPLSNSENPTMYATALGCFMVTNSDAAKKVYEEKIIKLYSNDQNAFQENLPYYEQNWLWFGG